ncbi:MAG: hypothetical protein M0R48_09720 [Candidatus Omnitrophica bacterium]|nr:hypothetical protein [Candidatus Omnitrophota bacterium]
MAKTRPDTVRFRDLEKIRKNFYRHLTDGGDFAKVYGVEEKRRKRFDTAPC